jgi:xanthine/uracil permease
MKIFGELAAITVAFLISSVLLFWGIAALIYYPWADDCRDAGNSVQEYGYGIPMLTSTYVCVDSNGNAVDWL